MDSGLARGLSSGRADPVARPGMTISRGNPAKSSGIRVDRNNFQA